MTNQEAIKELSEWLDGCCGGEEIEPTRQALRLAISALQEKEEKTQLSAEGTTSDLISRKAVIDAVDSETVSTNPENFKSSEKFIKFMDDADIASFGKWQWANGFNTALVAATIQLKKLPSAQPERKKGKWLPENRTIDAFWVCSSCGFPSEAHAANILYNLCPNCGADMRGDNHDQSK